MATEVDHDAIKEAIVAILVANTSLYDVNNEAKVMSITVGKPNIEGIPNILPGIYVTNSPVLETIRAGQIVSNVHKNLEHTIRYLIVIGVAGADAPDTEEKIDDFQKLILETLEVNSRLTNNVDLSYPERVDSNVIKRAGEVIQLRQITLKCQKTTS